ncbi:hypothetical protein UT300009_09860 [Paraclostridium bifermentans]
MRFNSRPLALARGWEFFYLFHYARREIYSNIILNLLFKEILHEKYN